MILTTICLALIALTGGMFLLEKATKDNLNLFTKIVAWFIIVVSILCIGCKVFHTAMGVYGKQALFLNSMRMGERGMDGRMGMYDGMRRDGFSDGMDRDGYLDDMMRNGCYEGKCRIEFYNNGCIGMGNYEKGCYGEQNMKSCSPKDTAMMCKKQMK